MERLGRRQCWLLFGGALAIRLAFIAWAPGELSGDAISYHDRAVRLALGDGYVNRSGNPSVAWAPGWPLLLAALYWTLGKHVWLGLLANAILGAATTSMVAALGARLFAAPVGFAAGVVYALWPGNVYYAATLMTETFFNFALVGGLLLIARAVEPGRMRPAPVIFAAGLAFGAAALIKAEPLVVTPVLLLALFVGLGAERPRGPRMVVFVIGLVLVLSPWVIRNYVHFDRIIITTTTGPANAYKGNHRGATGGQDIQAALRFKRYKRQYPGINGYRLAWDFAVNNPREEAAILWKKLVLTYGSDDGAVKLIRGVRPVPRYLSPPAERWLRRIANGYWWGVVALAAVGFAGLRGWRPLAKVIVLGVPASWLLLHLVFMGGSRYHVPETPSFALCAGAGWQQLQQLVRRRLHRVGPTPAQLSA